MIIIGTTDTDFKEDPSKVHSTTEDVKYLLNVVEEYFPGAIRKEDILASYAACCGVATQSCIVYHTKSFTG